jgi:Transcriptional activator of glycolytic enzymes
MSLLASDAVTPSGPSLFLSEPAAAGPVLPQAPLPKGRSSDVLLGSDPPGPPLGSMELACHSSVPMPTMATVPALPPPNLGTLPPPLLSHDPHIASLQHSNWNGLVNRYGEQRLRHHHMWTWEGQGFMPYYTFQPVNTICEIWEEWSSGLNGFLSTRDLEERWGARWRRNTSGLKTENGRRKKVVGLVMELAAKPNWNVALALRFLQDRYEGAYKTPRKFCEFLQAKSNVGYQEVIAAASEYIH